DAKIAVPGACLRIQRDEVRAKDRDDSLVFAVGPIRNSPARGPAWPLSVWSGRRIVEPHHAAVLRIQGSNGAIPAADIEQTAHHDRRVLIVRYGRWGGPPLTQLRRRRRLPPGNAELCHRVFVDLIQR